jgi:hypothetical protein
MLNIVGLRGRLSEDPSLLEHIRRCATTVAGVKRYCRFPFESALELLHEETTPTGYGRTRLGPSPRQHNYIQFLFTFFNSAMVASSGDNDRAGGGGDGRGDGGGDGGDDCGKSQGATELGGNAGVDTEDNSFSRFILGHTDCSMQWTKNKKDPTKAGGVRASPFPIDTKSDFVDMTLFVCELDGALSCSFRYNADLITQSAACGMASTFRTLLARLTADEHGGGGSATKGACLAAGGPAALSQHVSEI